MTPNLNHLKWPIVVCGVILGSISCGQSLDTTPFQRLRPVGWLTPVAVLDACDSAESHSCIDEDSSTYWHHWLTEQHWIVLDMGKTYVIEKVRLNHNQFSSTYAVAEIFISEDLEDWGESAGSLHRCHDQESGWKTVDFEKRMGRYLKLVAEQSDSPYWSEIDSYVYLPRS